jgi:uncharacterized DUF497 family protein
METQRHRGVRLCLCVAAGGVVREPIGRSGVSICMSFLFEFDLEKALRNASRHGVSFAEAQTAFLDPLALEVPDPEHSMQEERLLLIGRTIHQRLLVVVFTERGDSIRIISAREATLRERRIYEEGS